MKDDWFEEWLENHLSATGFASDANIARLFLICKKIFVEEWRATQDELAACTHRIIASSRVPKFASEQTEAVGRELHELRQEKMRLQPKPPDHPELKKCSTCNGFGFVVVPHPRCIWNRQIALHPVYKKVITVAVICDRTGCLDGDRVLVNEQRRPEKQRERHPDRPTLRSFEEAANCDPVVLLAEYEKYQAALMQTTKI